jgi:hypothetical protein
MTLCLLFFVVVAFLVGALKNWLRSAKGKGQIGEFVVSRMLATLGSGYEVLNDLTFVVEGDSTQIDHVVVSTKGVFLIETKNYSGLIFGQANEGQWTQAMGHTKNRFQNPLRQNFKHVKFLSQNLEAKHGGARAE